MRCRWAWLRLARAASSFWVMLEGLVMPSPIDRRRARSGIMVVAVQCCSGRKSEVPECLSEGSSRSRLGREPGLTHFSGYFVVW